MIKSVTSSHQTDGSAYAVQTTTAAYVYYYYDVRLCRDVNFYLYNDDTETQTMLYTIDAFHKSHNFTGDPDNLPTDVVVTSLQVATSIAKGAFSAIEQVANATSYTHIAVGIINNSGEVDKARIYGWGRELR